MSDAKTLAASNRGRSCLSPVIREFGDLRLQTAGDVLALAYSSPTILNSVEEPGVLRHWNVQTGRAEGSFFLSDLETVWSFCAEGKALVTASDELSIWHVASGELITSLRMPSWVTTVAVRRSPVLIATGHDDGIVRLWDPAGHRLIRELAGHDRPIAAVAFNLDGQRIATAAEDRLICVWHVASGRQLGTLGRHTDRICGLAWHPGERLLVSAGWDRTARVWDTDTFEPIMLLNSHDDQVIGMALSPDGSLLACADSAPSIHLWNLDSFKETSVFAEHADEVRCLAFSPDGLQLATGGVGGAIRLWDPRHGRPLSSPDKVFPRRTQVAVSANGAHLVSSCDGAGIRTWNVATGEACAGLTEAGGANAFAMSPNGHWIAVGRDKTIVLRDAVTGEFRKTLEGQTGSVGALAFSPDSTMVASASADDGTVWLWDIQSAEPILVIPIAADTCTLEVMAFHPSGRLLAVGGIDWLETGGSDGAVCIWDLEKRETHALLNRGATALAFHPNGRWLATASLDRAVHIWDLQATVLVHTLAEHSDIVNTIVFSPDGSSLVSGSDDRSVRVWNPETGEPVALHRLDTVVKALAFSPDGQYLFSANGNTTNYQIDFARLLDEGTC